MAYRKLYFIRHGETDWNAARRIQGQLDIPLNDRGRGQAARNGTVLADLLPAPATIAFCASPLGRAAETMAIVRDRLGLPAEGATTDDRLKEIHYGRWQGSTWSGIAARDPGAMAAREADVFRWRPEGGESYADLSARVAAWLATVEGSAVVVSHGGVSRVLRGLVLDLAAKDIPELPVPQDEIMILEPGRLAWA